MAQETEGSQANDNNMSTIRNSPPIIVAKCTVEQAPRRMPLALLDALVIALCASTQSPHHEEGTSGHWFAHQLHHGSVCFCGSTRRGEGHQRALIAPPTNPVRATSRACLLLREHTHTNTRACHWCIYFLDVYVYIGGKEEQESAPGQDDAGVYVCACVPAW